MLRRLFVGILLAVLAPALAQTGPTVFAAASLADALRELDAAWQARGNLALRLNLAASSTLARQIEAGAGADLFISADEAWMDHLQARGLIVAETRVSPIGNTLVLVAPPGSGASVALVPGLDLRAALGPRGRLAVADPAHVPAGRYAQQALTALGAWPGVAPLLARAENVRAALLLVERGEAPLGIVYGTDAAASAGVRVVATFPHGSHAPVSYPFAIVTGRDSPRARLLLAFLTGPEARPVWQRHGFAAP
jgi:molybdate transport system substrate-binding protein